MAAEVPTLRPELLSIAPALDDRKERNNLSGAACNPQGVLSADRRREALRPFLHHRRRRAAARARASLSPDHGRNGRQGKRWRRRRVCRRSLLRDRLAQPGQAAGEGFAPLPFPLSRRPPGGAPTADIGSETTTSPAVERVSLDAIIRAHPLLSRHLTDAPGDTWTEDPNLSEPSHGVNIEGLAMGGNRMFVGFRGPVDEGGAIVLGLGVNDLFAGAAQQAEHTDSILAPARACAIWRRWRRHPGPFGARAPQQGPAQARILLLGPAQTGPCGRGSRLARLERIGRRGQSRIRSPS